MVSSTQRIFAFMICLFGIIFALPNIISKENFYKLPGFMQNAVNLGLELRGGSHLQLEVNLTSATRDYLDQIKNELRNRFRKENIGYTNLCMAEEGYEIRLTLRDETQKDLAKKIIDKLGMDLEV